MKNTVLALGLGMMAFSFNASADRVALDIEKMNSACQQRTFAQCAKVCEADFKGGNLKKCGNGCTAGLNADGDFATFCEAKIAELMSDR